MESDLAFCSYENQITTYNFAVFSGLFVAASVVTSILGFVHSVLNLDESQVSYLFSTSAQVLAAVYGLTLTGFIFFRNELSREEAEDDTLIDVEDSLKRK